MKNKIKNVLFVTLVAVVSSALTSLVMNNNLSGNKLLGSVSHSDYLDSSNVTYLDSNVQDSIDNLYTQANDYSSINNRVNTLEGYFKNNPTSYFDEDKLYIGRNSSDTTSTKGIFFANSNVNRGSIYYHPTNDEFAVISRGTTGTAGSGTLALYGNPVQINGVNYSSITSNTYTYKGITFYLYKIGRIVMLRIHGTASESLSTNAKYLETITLPSQYRPNSNFLSHEVFNESYSGQIVITTAGLVKLGYVRYRLSEHVDLPKDAGVWVSVTYLSAN